MVEMRREERPKLYGIILLKTNSAVMLLGEGFRTIIS